MNEGALAESVTYILVAILIHVKTQDFYNIDECHGVCSKLEIACFTAIQLLREVRCSPGLADHNPTLICLHKIVCVCNMYYNSRIMHN